MKMLKSIFRIIISFLLIVTCSANGAELYVASAYTNNVLRYDINTGGFIDVFTSGGGLSDPIGIEFGPDGNLYISNEDGDVVLRYDGDTGEYIDVFASEGGLNSPRDLAFGADGNLYVVSEGTSQVLRYNGNTGDFIDSFDVEGGSMILKIGLAFGPDGDLYVTSNNGVLKFDVTTTALLGTFVDIVNDSIAFGPDDNLYLGYQSEILRYDGKTGEFIDVFASGGSVCDPVDLVFGPDGILYASNFNCSEISRYDGNTGAVIDIIATDELSLPTGLAFKSEVNQTPAGYMTCYKIRRSSDEPRFEQREVVVENEFGEQRYILLRPDTLCVPSVVK